LIFETLAALQVITAVTAVRQAGSVTAGDRGSRSPRELLVMAVVRSQWAGVLITVKGPGS
jgi:hypothetical protein